MNARRCLQLLLMFIATPIGVATAAIPTLGQQELELFSSHIMTGYVYSIRDHEEVVRDEGTNTVYSVKMIVYDVEKGAGYERGNVVTFTFRRIKPRERGEKGPVGQSDVVPVHAQVRVFLSKSDTGQFKLVEPNGWEKICY